jgi:hypothetical protein
MCEQHRVVLDVQVRQSDRSGGGGAALAAQDGRVREGDSFLVEVEVDYSKQRLSTDAEFRDQVCVLGRLGEGWPHFLVVVLVQIAPVFIMKLEQSCRHFPALSFSLLWDLARVPEHEGLARLMQSLGTTKQRHHPGGRLSPESPLTLTVDADLGSQSST